MMRQTFAIALIVFVLQGLYAPTALASAPDSRRYYTSPLDELGVSYDIWDVATQNDPSASDLTGYRMVIWFTGYPRSDTFTSANEAAVSTYLSH